MSIIEDKVLKKRIDKFWKDYENKSSIKGLNEKFVNINGKTSRNDVPKELYTDRTPRTNRVLLAWKVIKDNPALQSIDNLNLFESGICVEFRNLEFNEVESQFQALKKELQDRLGSNENVSSIWTIRDDQGIEGGFLMDMLKENNCLLLNQFNSSKIKRARQKGNKYHHIGNDNWKGKYFYSIKTGFNKKKQMISHKTNNKPSLFNPANEYANDSVCNHISFVLTYFALHCYDIFTFIKNDVDLFSSIVYLRIQLRSKLSSISYCGNNLLDYCNNEYYLSPDSCDSIVLIDPISTQKISIHNFGLAAERNRSIELCHFEPASNNRFENCTSHGILSPARPDNLFWGFRESNLFQQTYTLEEYFKLVISRAETYKKYIEE